MKIAIVTGGDRGLGRNAALALARRDVDSITTYRSNAEEAFDELVDVHLKGVFFLIRSLLPVIADGGGVVRDDADFNALLASQSALGRVGLPDDIGGVVASPLSDDTRWVTGQRLEVSGGTHP